VVDTSTAGIWPTSTSLSMTRRMTRPRRHPAAPGPTRSEPALRRRPRPWLHACAACRPPPATRRRATARTASSVAATPSVSPTTRRRSSACWCALVLAPRSRARTPTATGPTRSHPASTDTRGRHRTAQPPAPRRTPCTGTAGPRSRSAWAAHQARPGPRPCALADRAPRSPAHDLALGSPPRTQRNTTGAPPRTMALTLPRT
jgi:hypothetical protein